ncbi:MAG: glycosyltransferase [Verrucomicrobiaceae bacterium]|nr:glycosyltransferase [Verrucomicrobiaceae bacterium]
MNAHAPIKDVAVVLPAYNEERDLPALLARLKETLEHQPFGYNVVVVDDGSKDRTAEIAQEAAKHMPVHLVKHGVNRGLGCAISTGLREAVKYGDLIVSMDADNSHDPAYITDMVRHMNTHDTGLVIASRFRKGSIVKGVPAFRQAMSWGCFLFMKSIVPYREVRDYSTGFRGYRASVLQRLIMQYGDKLVEESGFVCMLEVLLKLRAIGAKAAEIPYTLRYDLKAGASKMRVFRTIKRYFSVVNRYRAALPPKTAVAASGKPVPVPAAMRKPVRLDTAAAQPQHSEA